ncbi:MAG: hypothetical protein JW909_04650 [Planctomycetes bacterium]|nr:hypothetical protein [Planctomycetota bacterium]
MSPDALSDFASNVKTISIYTGSTAAYDTAARILAKKGYSVTTSGSDAQLTITVSSDSRTEERTWTSEQDVAYVYNSSGDRIGSVTSPVTETTTYNYYMNTVRCNLSMGSSTTPVYSQSVTIRQYTTKLDHALAETMKGIPRKR